MDLTGSISIILGLVAPVLQPLFRCLLGRIPGTTDQRGGEEGAGRGRQEEVDRGRGSWRRRLPVRDTARRQGVDGGHGALLRQRPRLRTPSRRVGHHRLHRVGSDLPGVEAPGGGEEAAGGDPSGPPTGRRRRTTSTATSPTSTSSRMAAKTKYCTGRIKSFVIPLSNYSLDTSNPGLPVSFFELLGLLEGLKGITSDSVTSGCALRSLSSGSTVMVNKTDAQLLKQFTAHFVSSVDEERACNYAAFMPMQEITPLQKAEWIKYLGTFANAEVRANAVYDAVKSNYLCLTNMAANQTARFKPVVAWVEYDQGIWSFAKESYKQQLVTDAGGENVDDSIASNSYSVSNPDDMDNFHAILCTIDVVIDQTSAPVPEQYTLSTFMENVDVSDNSCFVFLTNHSLWRYDKRVRASPSGGQAVDWFDGAISQPQLVLADLIEAFFPTGNYTTTFLRNLAKGEEVAAVGPETCDRGSSAPLEPTIVPCQ